MTQRWGPQQWLTFNTEIANVRTQIDVDKAYLTTLYTNVDQAQDMRFGQFNLLSNTLSNAIMHLILLARCMLNDAWWDAGNAGVVSRNDRIILNEEYMVNGSQNLLLGIFNSLEMPFGHFERTLAPAPATPRTGNRPFHQIYTNLLNNCLNQNFQAEIVLLDFLRLMRNTIHNNGHYFTESGTDREIEYKGVRYRFEHGRPFTFITWQFSVELADDVRQLMRKVAQDPRLVAVQTHVGW